MACAGHCELGANGAPNARADTGRPGTGPRTAPLKPIKPSGPLGDAWASHRIHADLPGRGNAADQLNLVASETSPGRKNSAVVYSKANGDFSAMAAGGHGDHVPVSVKLGRNCRRSETDDCESGRESEGAHTVGNPGCPHSEVRNS
jgi:hypothetical protein